MNLYAILRRSGWKSPGDLQEAAERSTEEGERMSDDIRWIGRASCRERVCWIV